MLGTCLSSELMGGFHFLGETLTPVTLLPGKLCSSIPIVRSSDQQFQSAVFYFLDDLNSFEYPIVPRTGSETL